MSDMLPLLIKTPNGRLQSGTKRDCFTLNPRMTNPEWMKCYNFIGAMVGRYMVKDDQYFGIPMAPTFWMLIQDNESPTLDDFAKEDARLQKRLKKFEACKELGSEWPEDEFWDWIDSNDERILINDGEQVTRENYPQFCEALLGKLTEETAGQIKHVKRGVQKVLGDFNYLRQYLNWHDIMVLSETDKLKQYNNLELIKEKTIYINCQAEDEMIANFWKIFEKLNSEDKKAYFNFVSGKSRIADDAERFYQEHRVRVDANMAENETPKSKPNKFEIILASSYTTIEQMKAKMLEAIGEGCGLEADQD